MASYEQSSRAPLGYEQSSRAYETKDWGQFSDLVSDGRDRSIQDNVSKLRLISKIKVGDILDTTTLQLWRPGFWASTYRTFIDTSNSRNSTLIFFRKTVSDAFILLKQFDGRLDQVSMDIKNMLIENLKRSVGGMQNTIDTYKGDPKFGSQLETLIETIENSVKDPVIYEVANPEEN